MSLCATTNLKNAPSWFVNTKPVSLGDMICVPASREIYAQIRSRFKSEENHVRYLVHDTTEPVSIPQDAGSYLLHPTKYPLAPPLST